MNGFTAMAVFALVTSLSPGPVNILAAVSGANNGYRRTVPHISGATIGFVSLLMVVGFGFAGATRWMDGLTELLVYPGGAFLLFLSYKIITSKSSEEFSSGMAGAPSFVAGILCQWLNPKAWIVSVSAVSVFAGKQLNGTENLLSFCGIFLVVCYASVSVWAMLGSAVRFLLEEPRHFRLFNVLMGLLLALTVVSVFLSPMG